MGPSSSYAQWAMAYDKKMFRLKSIIYAQSNILNLLLAHKLIHLQIKHMNSYVYFSTLNKQFFSILYIITIVVFKMFF